MSLTVFQSRVSVSERKSSGCSVDQPTWAACSEQERERQEHEHDHRHAGPEQARRNGRPLGVAPLGLRQRQVRGARHLAIGQSTRPSYSRLASRSRLIATEPSPSWRIVIGSGRSEENGTSGLAVTTPEPSGYS